MAHDLTTQLLPGASSPTRRLIDLRPAELVELSERLYRGIFRAALLVALATTAYAFALVFVQVGPINRPLAAAICVACAAALLPSLRNPALVYEALRRQPRLALAPPTALALAHVAIGAGSELLFPLSLIVIGGLSATVSIRWVLIGALLVGVSQASPVFTDDLTGNAARPLVAAAAADIFAPLLFAALLERLSRFILGLQRAIDNRATERTPPLRARRPTYPSTGPRSDPAAPLQLPPATARAAAVTARQQQVILLVSLGESYFAIAQCLGISEGHVTKLLANARHRAGVTTTQQLVRWAITTGLVSPASAIPTPES